MMILRFCLPHYRFESVCVWGDLSPVAINDMLPNHVWLGAWLTRLAPLRNVLSISPEGIVELPMMID